MDFGEILEIAFFICVGGFVIFVFICGLVYIFKDDDEDDGYIPLDMSPEHHEENNSRNTTENSHNYYFDVKVGNLIIHPDGLKELGDAAAKMLESGSAYYDRDKGILVLEGKTKDGFSSSKIKQLLPEIIDVD